MNCLICDLSQNISACCQKYMRGPLEFVSRFHKKSLKICFFCESRHQWLQDNPKYHISYFGTCNLFQSVLMKYHGLSVERIWMTQVQLYCKKNAWSKAPYSIYTFFGTKILAKYGFLLIAQQILLWHPTNVLKANRKVSIPHILSLISKL